MLLVRISILILSLLVLQGCASTRMGEQYQQGRASFVGGNFPTAFHELLPVAAYGNPKAQYAIGYMYYNGIGVAQDQESGIFWMSRSAEKGYGPAQQALQRIMDQNLKQSQVVKVEETRCQVVKKIKPPVKDDLDLDLQKPLPPKLRTASNVKRVDRDEVLQSLISPQIAVKQAVPVTLALNTRAPNYTLQLFSSYSEDEVKVLQTKLAHEKLTRFWHTKNEGKDWFVLTYGEFKTLNAARLAMGQLPFSMQAMQPQVRPLSQIEVVSV